MNTAQKFELGLTLCTRGAFEALKKAGQSADFFVGRHASGAWGDMCRQDMESNEAAVKRGGRILSAHILNTGKKIWIVTEADRSATTILLPEEY